MNPVDGLGRKHFIQLIRLAGIQAKSAELCHHAVLVTTFLEQFSEGGRAFWADTVNCLQCFGPTFERFHGAVAKVIDDTLSHIGAYTFECATR